MSFELEIELILLLPSEYLVFKKGEKGFPIED